MKLYMSNGGTAETDLTPEELYTLFLAAKKGAKVFVLLVSEHGKVYKNIAFIDCHKTLEDIMVGLDRDTPIPYSVVPDTEQP